jgi:hypothetical protein
MSKSTGWFSNGRDGVPAMARDWISVCAVKKPPGTSRMRP